MRRPVDVPAYGTNLYLTRAILDPYPHYARLREVGPLVWLTKQRRCARSHEKCDGPP